MSEDVVIVGAARTAVGSFNGALSSLPAHELGAVAMLPKPFRVRELRQTIQEALGPR